MNAKDVLAIIEHTMTEVDLVLWAWQTDLDMMSFIGQDSIKTYVPDTIMYRLEKMDVPPIDLTVKRVPLVRHEHDKRIIIGIADVDTNSGVYKATVQAEYADLFTIPGAYSIRDGEPPEYDHDLIKSQLKRLADPAMYVNPFKIQGVTAPIPKPDDDTIWELAPVPVKKSLELDWKGDRLDSNDEEQIKRIELNVKKDGEWHHIGDIVPDPENHEFFKEYRND